MDKELEKLQKHLQEHFDSTPNEEITISEKLYISLTNEAKKIDDLLKLVECKRAECLLRVLLPWDIVSEQRNEIPVPEKWLDKEMIKAIRAYIAMRDLWEEYLESIPMKEAKRALSSIRRILNKWSEMPKRIDAFEKKPKWSVIIYDVLQDCTKNEFLKSMWCVNDEQLMENFGNMTMNLQQVDYLCKLRKLNNKEAWMILSIVDKKIVPLEIQVSSGQVFYRNNYSPRLTKGMKVLLFVPWGDWEK